MAIISRDIAIPAQVLAQLYPNVLLEAKFRQGYRKALFEERGWRPPRGLYEASAAQSLVRAMVRRAFGSPLGGRLEVPAPPLTFSLVLRTWEVCDDDAFLFLVKPALDGVADALGWTKDRRRIAEFRGAVEREPATAGLTVTLLGG